jgi:4-hydroxy-3-methylbut-2-enyl diphosphate reductase
MIENCRVFIPSSQISNRYVEDLKSFKGKELNFHILEFDRSKRRIVAGRKELAGIEQQQRRDELFASLEPGQRLEGTVSRIVEFGAFIDLGGVDGLIHISELAWRRVRKVTDVLQVGDAVTVTVIDINPEMNKISLSLKDINANPWNNIAERYPIGSIIEGKVVRLASFGAFINLEEGLDGLVHVSQIADRHIAKPDEVLTVGDVIKVKVTDIDEANHKLSLSKREADVDYGVTAAEEEYMEEEFLSEAVEDEPGENIEESF